MNSKRGKKMLIYDMDSSNNLNEDTDDASETASVKQDIKPTEIKEQMYRDKLMQLKNNLQSLKDGTLSEYLKKLKSLEQQRAERHRINELRKQLEMELIEQDYLREKKLVVKEFEDKKIDLRENLIADLEERKKHLEIERQTMDLAGDCLEIKVVSTRKLRRRPNEPVPLPEKRRKASPAQLNYLLDEHEIHEDLEVIEKLTTQPNSRSGIIRPLPNSNANVFGSRIPANASSNTDSTLYEARIEDGKLIYDNRRYHRNQSVILEGKELSRMNAVIVAINTQEILLRKTSDNGKLRVYLNQLQRGRYIIKKRVL